MTNYDFLKKRIVKAWMSGECFGIVNNNIVPCEEADCKLCLYECFCEDGVMSYEDEETVSEMVIKWLDSEYEEPKIDPRLYNAPVDTKVLVSCNRNYWEKEYLAKIDEKGKLFTWRDGRTSFSAMGENDIALWQYAKLYEEGK